MASSPQRSRQSFTVPAGAGSYAPEVIQFTGASTSTAPEFLLGTTALIEQAVAGATVELWLLKVGGNPATSADYFLSSTTLVSGHVTASLASWPGCQWRVKSGGTAGTAIVNASAD